MTAEGRLVPMDVVGTVISIFLLVFLGYGTKKLRLLHTDDAAILNNVVLYLTLPAFIFNAIYAYDRPLPPSMVKVPVVGFALEMVVLGLAYLAGHALKLDRPTLGGLMLASAFGNTGFLGYPVVVSAFHRQDALVTAVLYDELAMALPLYTIGVLVAAGFAGQRIHKGQLLQVLALPSMWAIPAAFALRFVQLPTPVVVALDHLGAGTIPLVMISLGLSLSARSLKGLAVPLMIGCALKLAALPLLTHYAAVASGITGMMHKVTVLEAGMPSAMMSGVIAARFGTNGRFVAGIIFLSTLLSTVTILAILLMVGR